MSTFTLDYVVYTISGSDVSATGFSSPPSDWNLVIPNSVTHDSTTYSVTSIGSTAFINCTNLLTLVIGSAVSSVGNYAFYQCNALTSVTIPASVTSFGSVVFQGCIAISSVTFNNSFVGDQFLGLTNLTSVTIGNSVLSIADGAFSGTGLISVVIPNSVTSIGSSAFSSCSNLLSLTIGNSVASIGNYAFLNCTALTSVAIPASITSFGTSLFSGCTGLTSVTLNNSFIGNQFVGLTNLTSVTIGNSVTSIGNGVFEASGLTSVLIPNSVTSIGSTAFINCSSLLSLEIGSSVASIGNFAFYGCTALTSVMVHNQAGIATIGMSIFSPVNGTVSFMNTKDYASLSANGQTISSFFNNINYLFLRLSVAWNGTMWIASAGNNSILYSYNGINWMEGASPLTYINGIACKLGVHTIDSSAIILDNANSNSLDVVSDKYYNTGFSNFSVNIKSSE
jgi:hypothetical protein